MKKILLFSILLLTFACKKEETQTPYTKYDITFKVNSSLDPIVIAYTESTGKLRAEIVNQPGLTFAYGTLTSGDQVFVTASKINKIDSGWVKCQYNIQGKPFYIDSVWLPDSIYYHTFEWKVPK